MSAIEYPKPSNNVFDYPRTSRRPLSIRNPKGLKVSAAEKLKQQALRSAMRFTDDPLTLQYGDKEFKKLYRDSNRDGNNKITKVIKFDITQPIINPEEEALENSLDGSVEGANASPIPSLHDFDRILFPSTQNPEDVGFNISSTSYSHEFDPNGGFEVAENPEDEP